MKNTSLDAADIDACTEIIAEAAVVCGFGDGARRQEVDELRTALKDAQKACDRVNNLVAGWTLGSLIAAAKSTHDSMSSVQCWLDVPVIVAGLILWARRYREATSNM